LGIEPLGDGFLFESAGSIQEHSNHLQADSFATARRPPRHFAVVTEADNVAPHRYDDAYERAGQMENTDLLRAYALGIPCKITNPTSACRRFDR
jgi:hypothetical protein